MKPGFIIVMCGASVVALSYLFQWSSTDHHGFSLRFFSVPSVRAVLDNADIPAAEGALNGLLLLYLILRLGTFFYDAEGVKSFCRALCLVVASVQLRWCVAYNRSPQLTPLGQIKRYFLGGSADLAEDLIYYGSVVGWLLSFVSDVWSLCELLRSALRHSKGTEKARLLQYDGASLLSCITYSWIQPLFAMSASGKLLIPSDSSGDARVLHRVVSALPALPRKLMSYASVVSPLENLARDAKVTANQLWRLVHFIASLDGGREFLWVCMPLKISQDLLSIASQYTVRGLVQFIERQPEMSTAEEVLAVGLAVTLLSVGTRFVQSLLFEWYLSHLYTSSLRITVALKVLIMKSVLDTPLSAVNAVHDATTSTASKAPSIHQAISLFSVDAENCGESLIFLHNTWSHPIVILCALASMANSIGYIPTLVTFTALILAIPLNEKVSGWMKKPQTRNKLVERRVSDLAVALPSMRSVHATSLQSAFLSRIESSRNAESENFCDGVLPGKSFSTAFSEFTIILVYVVCYGCYLLFGSDTTMRVSALLPAAASLSILRFPIWAAPNLRAQVERGYRSATRIAAFLYREKGVRRTAESVKRKNSAHSVAVECKEIDFYWASSGERKRALQNVTLSIPYGECVLIKGGTGAGKSALLLALLGELHPKAHHSSSSSSSGCADQQEWCHGSVVYCAETPWLFDGSIRENITMRPGGAIEESEWSWYETVIQACDLQQDLAKMVKGDLTPVGNAGCALSGGQRARVSLARALFYRRGQTDIFIFDNVLSALDYDIQHRIIHTVFKRLILERGKTMLIVSSVCSASLESLSSRVLQVTATGEVIPGERSLGSPSVKSPALSYEPGKDSAFSLNLCKDDPYSDGTADAPSGEVAPFSILPCWKDLKAVLWVHFGPRQALQVLGVIILRQLLFSMSENWMGLWFHAQKGQACQSETPSLVSRLFRDVGGCSAVLTFIVTYALVGTTTCVASFWKASTFFAGYQKAADRLQMSAVRKVFAFPPSYFDKSSAADHVTQVLVRDQSVVDRLVAESVQLIITSVLQLLAVIAVNMLQHPLFALVVPILGYAFYHLNVQFLQLSKQLRLLESNVQEKSVKCLNDAVAGAVTLRAYGPKAVEGSLRGLCGTLDTASTVAHSALTNDRWVALRLDILSLFLLAAWHLVIVCSFYFHFESREFDSSIGSALAGLGALALMNSTQQLGQLCRRLGMLQSQFVSAERLVELVRHKPNVCSSVSTATPSSDDRSVALVVNNLSCRYQQHLPDALSSMSFTVRVGECLGVVGRSGNGKSSVLNALLRVVDVVTGSVRVASPSGAFVDALSVDLEQLRTKFFYLVPQEPLIVEGTLRENLLLGCTEAVPDDALVTMLQTVGMAEFDLSFDLTAGGRNVSAGQRQLLSVGRALLHHPTVLLLDEVTAKIDEDSEKQLVAVLKREVKKGLSIILISHRQETVVKLCNRVIVVSCGSVGSLFESDVSRAFETFDTQ